MGTEKVDASTDICKKLLKFMLKHKFKMVD